MASGRECRTSTKFMSVIFCIVGLSVAGLADSILLNGSFELYTAKSDDAFINSQLHAGMNSSRYVNDWSRSSNGTGLCASGDGPFLGEGNVADGSIAVYLQNEGWISQSFAVSVPGTYELSFRYASRPGNYLNGRLSVKVKGGDEEKTIGCVDCPVAIFRTAYMKVFLEKGEYELKIAHDKGSSEFSGDSVVDIVQLKLMGNIVSNGSFEDYRNENNDFNSYKTFVDGSFSPECWSWEKGEGNAGLTESDTPFVGAVPDGDVAVYLQKNASSVSQTIVASTTGVHVVSFRYAGRINYFNGILHAKIDGTDIGSVKCVTDVFRSAYFKADLVAGSEYALAIVNDASVNGSANSVIDCISVVPSDNLILNGDFDKSLIFDGTSYKLIAEADAYCPFWNCGEGKVGITIGGKNSAWIQELQDDVGAYALYLQTRKKDNYPNSSSLWQDFHVGNKGLYALRFSYAARTGNHPVNNVKVRLRRGSGTNGDIVSEHSFSSQGETEFAVFEKELTVKEPGTYTIEFFNAHTDAEKTMMIDNVSFRYAGRIRYGTIVVFQ